MKKLLGLALCMTLLLTGCSSKGKVDDGKTHIGILQIMRHGSLDQAYQGFKDAMQEEGYIEGENIVYDLQVGTNNSDTLTSMAQKLVADQNDGILAIGTGAAQTLMKETTEIPIVGSSITDYVEAGLAKSNEKPGGNVTGMSDAAPIEQQIELLTKLAPEAQTIGILYTSSEINSEIQALQAKAAIEARNLKCEVKTIADQTTITDTLTAMAKDIDALYIPSDNVIASAMGAVEQVTCDEKIPCVVAVEEMCKDGALATYGISYYKLGQETGHMMAKILRNEAKPADMAIGIMNAEDAITIYNPIILEKLEMTLPESLKDSAQALDME